MSTLIRNTTTLECGIDRRVDRAGHGEHGGWSLSQRTTIICFCGERLLELADLQRDPQAAAPDDAPSPSRRMHLAPRKRHRPR